MKHGKNYNILVLMSTYNGEKYLREQLDSIILQENCNVRILIRDDGSNDGTIDIINLYKEKYDNITFVSDNENLGPAKSYMKLLMDAPYYDYYAFADQDDIWYSDKLLVGCDALKQYNSPALYCANAELADENGHDLNILVNKREKIFLDYKTVLLSGQFMGCTMVFNKELAQIIKDVGAPNVLYMHDKYLSASCALVGGNIFYDFTPHMFYRQHNKNTVGVQVRTIAKIKDRMGYILEKKEVPIHAQAKELLRLYKNSLTDDKKDFLQLLSNMEHRISSRIKLCGSTEIHFRSLNANIVNRLAILLGNI